MHPSFLDARFDEMIRRASEARQNAYAPYSGFTIGAAILAKNGKIISACNVENASFGLTICAERAAVFKAISEGEKEFDAIAIVADEKQLVTPCGACRQVLAEFEPDLTVVMSNVRLEKKIMKLSDLLPDAFSLKNMRY